MTHQIPADQAAERIAALMDRLTDSDAFTIPRTELDALLAERDQLRMDLGDAFREVGRRLGEATHLRVRLDTALTEIERAETERDAALRQRAIFRDRLAHTVVAARVESEDADGFIAWYLMPTGPIHKAIHELQEYANITVRPGLDGRKHPNAGPDPLDPGDAQQAQDGQESHAHGQTGRAGSAGPNAGPHAPDGATEAAGGGA